MSKIKLTKNELKKQKDSLKMFNRYLPILQLRKQQLYLEIKRIEEEKNKKKLKQNEIKENISSWISLFGEKLPFEDWIRIKLFKRGSLNIAGVVIPSFIDVEYENVDYNLLYTPYWADKGVFVLKEILKINLEIEVLEEQTKLLEIEFRKMSQRVNLFEKIMIPQIKSNIRNINIYLGDQQTAAVIRGKIAKNNLVKKV